MDDSINQSSTTLLSFEDSYNLILKRTRQLVNQLIGKRGNDKPPFLPEEYASVQGINNIVREDLGEVSGMLLRFHDGHIIKVNKKHNLARQNYSLAHEIAHNLLRDLKISLNTDSISYRTFNPQAHRIAKSKTISRARERLCDIAAAELLMPESVFIKYLSGFGTSIHSIEHLASIFRVSIRAAAQRVAEVSIEPCVAMIWQKFGTTNLLDMSLSEGPGINLTNVYRYLPISQKVKSPSILHKAYEQDNSVKCYKSFKHGKDVVKLPMESKGFGKGNNRFVVSLAFPER